MRVLVATFPPGSRLLELGCGTGTAAISLAEGGHEVLALDISERMVVEARRKVEASGLQDRVVVMPGRAGDLLRILERSPWKVFDGGYANFSLTYEPDLRSIAEALAGVLRPGSLFVCTVPNRVVLSEMLIYGPQLRFGKVLWRFAKPLMKDVHGSMLEIRAYSPWELRHAFGDAFRLTAMRGIPTFLPPVYLHPQFRRLGGGQRLLKGLDERLAGRFPWSQLGEHTLFVFQRKRGSVAAVPD